MRKFLAGIPFVLLCLAPDTGAPAGGGTAPAKPESSAADSPPAWAPTSDAAPEIEGDTFEKKVENAKSTIGTLFGHLKSAFTAFKSLQGDHKTLETQFNELKQTAQAEKDAHAETKGLLETEKSEHGKTREALGTEKEARAKSDKNVERLESLCDLKGIDKNQVVKPAASASGGDKKQEYLDLKAQENKGEVPRGTASKFYNKHKKEIEG